MVAGGGNASEEIVTTRVLSILNNRKVTHFKGPFLALAETSNQMGLSRGPPWLERSPKVHFRPKLDLLGPLGPLIYVLKGSKLHIIDGP